MQAANIQRICRLNNAVSGNYEIKNEACYK